MTLPSILTWNWSIELIIAAALVLTGYIWINKFNNIYKTLLFTSGLIVAEIALAFPLGPTPAGFTSNPLSCALPGGTLFSLHMIRHILLLMIAGPLLVAGLPKDLIQKIISHPHIKSWVKIFSKPVVGWTIGVGSMWFWHMPPVYNYLVTYSSGIGHLILPEVESISLLIAGAMLAWPVVSPIKEYRIHPLKGSLYLFLACAGCSILGMSITFGSVGYFQTAFASQPGPIWGLSQSTDQQLAGLFMWVPGCALYVSGAMALIARWVYQMAHPSYTGETAVNTQAHVGNRQIKSKRLPGVSHPPASVTATTHQ
jgi:cytochrome c oxidase assembly factor CtaG